MRDRVRDRVRAGPLERERESVCVTGVCFVSLSENMCVYVCVGLRVHVCVGGRYVR